MQWQMSHLVTIDSQSGQPFFQKKVFFFALDSAAEECSPPVNSSLSASRAAYQEFLNDTRKKHEEKDSKEVLFKRVEQKEDKEKRNSEELEIQDLSFDEV